MSCEPGTQVAVYVITGGQGRAEEDLACADLIHALATGCTAPTDCQQRVLTSAAADDLRHGISEGYRGVHPDDVTLACQIDTFDFAMRATEDGGVMHLEPKSLSG